MSRVEKSQQGAHNRVVLLMIVLMCVLVVAIGVQVNVFNLGQKQEIVELPLSIDSSTPLTPLLQITQTDTARNVTTNFSIRDAGLQRYIIVTDSCNKDFGGECLKVRSSPSTSATVVARLRNNMVLKISDSVQADGRTWYKIIFDEWLRYPERVEGEWYVAADYVTLIHDVGEESLLNNSATTTKRIMVDRSEQSLVAHEGKELFMEVAISTGLELTPTPRGTFTIYKKTPSRYMQGPLPYLENSDYYDLAGVPWNMYFTEGGAVIHGAYWHDSFGTPYSHGCVNMKPEEAQKLYLWADVGTPVVVKD